MMKFLREIGRFIRNLFRTYPSTPTRLEDSPELEEEKERRRGMRGDFI
jgi:hypothetical protein